ncbi:MAG: hypothetical protein VKO39_12435 [Cyanobacteriota bacterium]|nr:hypothetical protein [Cyanobacteriota bacterium]
MASVQVLKQWRRRLRQTDPSTRSQVVAFFERRLEESSLRGWDAWVAAAIQPELGVEGVVSQLVNSGTAIRAADLSRAQLIAVALCLLEERQISATALALSWLRERDALAQGSGSGPARPKPEALPQPSLADDAAANLLSGLLPGLVRHPQNPAAPLGAELSALAWALRQEELASDRRPSGGALMIWMAEANRCLQAGDRASGYRLLRDLLDPAGLPPPPGLPSPPEADGNAWQQLTINAATRSLAEVPRLTLIESKSLPRTGHHHLRRLLQRAHGEDFSHCERYFEPGCCKQFPCNAEPWWSHARMRGHHHLRLIKSHDYNLEDVPYPTPIGVVRLVQVRRPLPLLASWLELKHLSVNRELLHRHGIILERVYLHHEAALLETSWQLIDECGVAMERQEALPWLAEKSLYITNFLKKWLPLARPLPTAQAPLRGTYVLRYEDLGARAQILRAIGRDSPPDEAGEGEELFRPREGNWLCRPSQRISGLLNQLEDSLAECEARILEGSAGEQELLGYSAGLPRR